MFELCFSFLSSVDDFFWSYIGFSLIMLLGLYFTIKTGVFQLRSLPSVIKTFFYFLTSRSLSKQGTHPLKVFFASVGGMVGVGNIVGIVTALQIGGPGAIFWVWVATFLGALIKYSEVFLGLKYRVSNDQGGYDGGAIYFLKKAFNTRYVSIIASVLLCIYGAEVYQFSVLTHSISVNWNLNHLLVVFGLLFLIFFAAIGGIKRVGKICSLLMPFFTLCYLFMCLWVVGHHLTELPTVLGEVFKMAFTNHAAVGGFTGSTLMLALRQGISRSVYSADIGIGYDSIIQSETSASQIIHQARLSMLGVWIDSVICTLTLLAVLCTGLWKANPAIDSFLVIQTVLSLYFPYQSFFMPLLLFVLIYSTLISYLFVGFKCARFLHQKHGEKTYLIFSVAFLLLFSFFDQSKALLIMSLSGCLLLCINLLGIFRLRNEIEFSLFKQESPRKTDALSA
ncbi:MAG: Amino-acid carrier protein AlsT [Chlamydiae bacterium]|nr:Amino-acid carrier protein AlsT [Chlamydiota bacterium]